ncbi:glycosyltransferase family 4 protein [Helicobacter sp. MIT 05-5294]|uniref:glycosyltransferase family 4 protein n=1 Tax=Helicobacter sp. MIT 05-5294 TaxID=1548150 RepID=UPI00051FB4D0|nr:glycosyltransferase family 4 protein [Helicobacter sp. MIT 05-5294]TLD89099.1 glycosyltransferase family 1 protein [Helicobacter sp. MIT 05-5294]
MNLVFVRFKNSKVGGAEKYLTRLKNALEQTEQESASNGEDSKQTPPKIEVFSSGDYGQSPEFRVILPSFFPAFSRFLFFLFSYEKHYRQNPNAIYFSLERVLHCDIYRAGDGIHKQWLEIKAKGNVWLKFKSYFNPMNPIYTFVESRLFANAKIIITNSKMIRDSLIERFGIPPQKIRVIYNGISLPNPLDKTAAKANLCQKFPILAHKTLVLFVGSGYARKGVKESLLMLSRISNKNWHFLIVGKEKHQKHYENLAKELGILESVLFLGAQTEVSPFYAASDIFLFPTTYEPCSNATLEAASFGNAIITTKQNGAGELFNQEFLLDSPQDFIKGGDILTQLLSNPNLLEESQKSCSNAVHHLSIQNNLRQTLQIINELKQ